tara:strand:+ start:1030 stop:1968 length:939 start_codon:yes stop_codon:yes gene_type:complete
MSNILIIKHGSLGDIVQISGVLRDIRENNKDKKIFLMTTAPYVDLLGRCPFIDGVLIDKRISRWNLYYLFKLKKMIGRYNFNYVYDLQNSSRTSFYRKYLFNIKSWSSTETTLKPGTKKKDFDKDPVLQRFKFQLESSNIKTLHTLKPDFSWAAENVDKILNKYFSGKFIILFPFSSPQNSEKKWPYYNELIKIIKSKHKNFEIIIAPGQADIEDAQKINATIITNIKSPLNIMELSGLIKKSSFVISNDTGPAHIAAHLGREGVALFGPHTSPQKVSIETESFKSISSTDLTKLSAENVYSEIKKKLELIN